MAQNFINSVGACSHQGQLTEQTAAETPLVEARFALKIAAFYRVVQFAKNFY